MNSPKSNLLIAMDLSVHSCNAVRYVTRNCSPAMVKVRLMHVMPTAPEIFWDLEKEAFFKEQMKGKYAKWKREAKKEAQEGNYGTIVMGRRGLSRVYEFLMGRVANNVLSRAEGFAVWIVP